MLVGLQVAVVAIWSLARGPAAAPDSEWPGWAAGLANPVGVLPAAWADAITGLDVWLLQVPLLAGIAAIGVRLRHPAGDERRRLASVLAAGAVFVLLVVVGRGLWPAAAAVLDVLGSALLALALTSAVLRRRLHDVDVVVGRTFVYAVLTALIALVYLASVAAAGALGRELSPLGIGLLTGRGAGAPAPSRPAPAALDRALYGAARNPRVAVARLTEELAASRQQIVTAREEERSRLRRDLHDELGPTLAGLSMQLGDLREVVVADPDRPRPAGTPRVRRARRPRRRTSGHPGAAAAQPRRARPRRRPHRPGRPPGPRARRAGRPRRWRPDARGRGRGVPHRRGGPHEHRPARRDGPGLPGAVPDHATSCGSGCVDHGIGSGTRTPGVGIQSMRERAAELGGSVEVRDTEGGGTTVQARCPPVPCPGAHVMSTVRVLLVDDHAMFREGLRFMLERHDDIEVVGEGSDGDEVPDLVRATDPDVVVMDLAMPRVGGIEATEALVRRGSRATVLVLTLSEEDASVLAAVRAGARGYLVKGAAASQAVSAVRALAAGHAVFGPGLAGRMLDFFGDRRRESFEHLSTREREVLELVAAGRSNQQIADVLVISPVTVRNHVSAILAKLQVTNRREAMLRFHGTGGDTPIRTDV